MKKVLSKKDIFKQTALKTEVVPIPEWGGDVIVQEMTAIQREKFEEWVMSKDDKSIKGTRVAIVINTVIDEDGKQMFNDLDAMDLGKKPASIIDRIASVGLKLSKMSSTTVEEEAKNSGAVLNEDSTSGSAVN